MINAIHSCHNQYRANFRHNKHTYSETLQIRKELDKKVADLNDLGTLFMLVSLPFVLPTIDDFSNKMSKTEKIGGVFVILSLLCLVAANIKKYRLYISGQYKGGKNDPQNRSTK